MGIFKSVAQNPHGLISVVIDQDDVSANGNVAVLAAKANYRCALFAIRMQAEDPASGAFVDWHFRSGTTAIGNAQYLHCHTTTVRGDVFLLPFAHAPWVVTAVGEALNIFNAATSVAADYRIQAIAGYVKDSIETSR